jgi:hypothetical protein
LDDEFLSAQFAADTQQLVAYRQSVIQVVLKYHMASFFLLGLKDDLLKDVTKNNYRTLEEMVATARFSEQAQMQGRSRHTIAEVHPVQQESEDNGLSPTEVALIRKF